MKRAHAMPFGSEARDGAVRFRLWAPAAGRVELCLDGEARLEMRAADGGFFELITDRAGPGTRYGFRIDGGGLVVPDPASRFNPDDVHAPSAVVDPRSFEWSDADWQGRPWEEAVVYELHVGAFSASGDFDGVAARLPYLVDLGITAIELMPVAEFAGGRGWGYDGVLPFAPESRYGGPESLKRLVQAAHAHGLMVLLDVVYNHFGPEGNYLALYAPQFFTDRVETPWGQAIDFESDASRPVREFFIHNALYWIEEYNLDGLRIDAVHAIHDRCEPDVLEELADRVRAAVPAERHVHLVLENDGNEAHYLRGAGGAGGTRAVRRPRFDAQWNDDFHHAMHVLLTGETHGYYSDYADDPTGSLGRALAEGFVYQGQHSEYRGRPRGEPCADLPTGSYVTFLQNHDQVGNRALGERLSELAPEPALAAAQALMLLAPQPPMLFMGEELASASRFPYFCDFPPELGAAVADGRRREFARFPEFSDREARERIPDPNAPATFAQARLDWREAGAGEHARVLAHYRRLLAVRRDVLVPRLPGARGTVRRHADRCLEVRWPLARGAVWSLAANVGEKPVTLASPPGRLVFGMHGAHADGDALTLDAWTAAAFLEG